ncbi:MAG: hypothetical protein ABI904_00430 [Chloroflexota bacterium]
MLIVLWGGITWLGLYWHPERSFWQGLLIGFVSTVLLSLSDFGHPFGHIFSARYAGAPMDEILLSEGMPRTLYWNNEVSPNVHRLRAMGGLIFNLVGLLLSITIFQIASSHSIAREWMGWSAFGHGLIFVESLIPLPMIDGGTILKWTLVARGRTETEADEIIRRVDWAMGIVCGIVGLGLIAMKMWIAGAVLIGIGAVVIGVVAGKIR